MSDNTNPLDDLPTQLQGRLATLEVLVALLVAEKAQATRLLREADTRLTQIESNLLRNAPEDVGDQILKVMNAARQSLEGIGGNVRGLRG